jgi:RNA polymerase sigma-70 factor (ECF subfamily)
MTSSPSSPSIAESAPDRAQDGTRERPHPDSHPPPESHPSPNRALDRWFDRALPRVYGYFITRVGGNVPIAEDLTQETMLAAVDSRGLATADEPLAWVFGIARHKLLDHYRQQDRRRLRFAILDAGSHASLPDDRFLPELDLETVQTRDTIIATLQELPPRQRGAIVFRYLDGLDVTSTAATLGVSVHAAESLLTRGRRAFRHHYLRLSEGR